MRIIFFLLLVSLFSCKQKLTDKELRAHDIEGNWLVVYPDHDGNNSHQKKVYGEIQDSVVSLMGLKLVRFDKGGEFRQMDSLEKGGQWKVTDDLLLRVENGGEGYSPFTAEFYQYKNEVMELVETIRYNGESIQLKWKLKKLKGKEASQLFDDKPNAWRKRPATPETDEQLKDRLADMLDYYSRYYFLVDRESSYFIPSRVMLPFKFYQHAIGLRPLTEKSNFMKLFYDSTQAAKAHLSLDIAMGKLRGRFPSDGESFIHEYASYMKLMAGEIRKMNQ